MPWEGYRGLCAPNHAPKGINPLTARICPRNAQAIRVMAKPLPYSENCLKNGVFAAAERYFFSSASTRSSEMDAPAISMEVAYSPT